VRDIGAAHPAIAPSTSPRSARTRRVDGFAEIACPGSSRPAMPGHGFQRTTRARIAASACSSRSATTPTKSRITTTATMPGRCAIDDSSTDASESPTKSPASSPT